MPASVETFDFQPGIYERIPDTLAVKIAEQQTKDIAGFWCGRESHSRQWPIDRWYPNRNGPVPNIIRNPEPKRDHAGDGGDYEE